jgi:hypothetical protein
MAHGAQNWARSVIDFTRCVPAGQHHVDSGNRPAVEAREGMSSNWDEASQGKRPTDAGHPIALPAAVGARQ